MTAGFHGYGTYLFHLAYSIISDPRLFCLSLRRYERLAANDITLCRTTNPANQQEESAGWFLWKRQTLLINTRQIIQGKGLGRHRHY